MKKYAIFESTFSNSRYWSSNVLEEDKWVTILADAKNSGRPIYFINSYSCFLANRNQSYSDVLMSGICMVDGRPLAKLMSSAGKIKCHQMRGPDFFSTCVEELANKDVHQVLFGSTLGTCKLISQKLETRTGKHVPYICPPNFTLEDFDYDYYSQALKALNPQVLWIALGTPKQDIIAAKLARRMNGVAIIAVGAAFDFYSGFKPQAPRWIRGLYLEWLYRLVSEPQRLWKRYLIGNTGFVIDAISWRLRFSRLQK